jgi:hypothetical protein
MLVRLVMDFSGRLSWGGITRPVLNLVFRRIDDNKRRIDRIVASIRAGTYKPRRRRTGKPRARASPGARKPPAPSPLPQTFGWLLPLIPVRKGEYWHANALRDMVERWISDPEMAVLVEAAPVSLGRPLRSLCWMFGFRPPPSLAPPKRATAQPATPPAATAEASAAAPPAPSPPPAPPRKAKTAPPGAACGPPHPA